MFWDKSSNAADKTTADTIKTNASATTLPLQSLSAGTAPLTLEQTGLPHSLVMGLLAKHLLKSDVLPLNQLAELLGLRASLVQTLLGDAKEMALVENRQSGGHGEQRFTLSGAGRHYAQQLFEISGYLGPAPVPLAQYKAMCQRQSSRNQDITQERFDEALATLVLPDGMKSHLGPALNSKRPILIYGLPGTGKSYLCRHLNQLFDDQVLIPHAISIGNAIVQVFDPHVHEVIDEPGEANDTLVVGEKDPRWHRCKRPLVMVGGELNREMLDISLDSNSHNFRSSVGLRANNGILLIDDLGRQVISPKEIFNRWILPLEEGRDFLSLPSGEHFEVPFEQLLLFSTNLSPTELVDDAFLRRLGYKIYFGPLDKDTYCRIWRENCDAMGLSEEPEVVDFLFDHLYPTGNKPLLPCHPRDLLSIVSDQVKFARMPPVITRSLLQQAWDLYFVRD